MAIQNGQQLSFDKEALEPKAQNISQLLGFLSDSTLVDAQEFGGSDCGFLSREKLIFSKNYHSHFFVDRDGNIVGGTEIKTPNDNRLRWDFVIRINEDIFAFEFDGPDHYQVPRKVRSDNRKDEQARISGYKTIRWPYWVQPDAHTIRHYFGVTANIRTNFPHGFRGGTAYFPSCFCEKGIFRFEGELFSLPRTTQLDVIESLRVVAEREGGEEWVLPSQLRSLLTSSLL